MEVICNKVHEIFTADNGSKLAQLVKFKDLSEPKIYYTLSFTKERTETRLGILKHSIANPDMGLDILRH